MKIENLFGLIILFFNCIHRCHSWLIKFRVDNLLLNAILMSETSVREKNIFQGDVLIFTTRTTYLNSFCLPNICVGNVNNNKAVENPRKTMMTKKTIFFTAVKTAESRTVKTTSNISSRVKLSILLVIGMCTREYSV